MRFLKAATALLLGWGLSACGSVVSGTTQSIFVDTPMVSGVACKLADSKTGRWELPNAPGGVTVLKGDGPMTVACEKEGFEKGVTTFDETLDGSTLGNIILGGGIGFLIDAANGAAQRYPDKVAVWMKPKSFTGPEAEEGWYRGKREYEMAAASAETLKACQQASGENCETKAKEAAMAVCKANRGKDCGVAGGS